MQPNLRAKPRDIPTISETEFWRQEYSFFDHRPPNHGAADGSPEYLGWGIPPEWRAPRDAVEYVLACYREKALGMHVHDPNHRDFEPLHPMYYWSFVTICLAHFLWFRTTKSGFNWILNFFGVQEVDPFYAGYRYLWVPPKGGDPQHLPPPVYQEQRDGTLALAGGICLRIFRPWETDHTAPIPQEKSPSIDDMKEILGKVRSPRADREIRWPDDDIFVYVSQFIRNWFAEDVRRDWPSYRDDRISGPHWVKTLEREPGVPFFSGLAYCAKFNGRAYRLEDPDKNICWAPWDQMRLVPNIDLDRLDGYTDEQIQETYYCNSCRATRTCVPFTRSGHMCCHCYSLQRDPPDRPTLERCSMNRECRACPDRIDSNSELVNIKTRWNTPVRTGPFPR